MQQILTTLDINKLMIELNTFAENTNPIWPFAAFIVDENGKVIVKATDCAHISPLYHAESLAIHTLIQSHKHKNLGNLTLISNVEPDLLSISAIYWANVVQELSIQKIFFGLPFSEIQELWPFGIKITAQEIVSRFSHPSFELSGPHCPELWRELFLKAKTIQEKINQKHPTEGHISKDVSDFFECTL